MRDKVNPKQNFPQLEEKILKFWQKEKIFEKSLKQREEKPRFVFYEGPPTANAKPGVHHVLARVFKDLIPRYRTMRGFFVERKAGWDTHGLPVELEVEKKLKFSGKREIEKYGIEKFNKECKASVWSYKEEWERLTERIGFWIDLKNPYITYENDYIETLWWIVKQIWDKKLLYQDHKVVPYCPRCGTTLSSHELAQGYKNIKEDSVYLKLKVKGQKDTFFLVWTTTPWTLPANVALAVGKDIDYVKAKVGGEVYILAKEKLSVLDKAKILEEFKGKKLLGYQYQPIFNFTPLEIKELNEARERKTSLTGFINPKEKAFFVVDGDFVTTEEGTGIVHMAPAFGEDDLRAGKENNLPVLMTVDEEGKFIKEIKPWAGMFVKEADPLIIKDLAKRGILFKQELYGHDYPFCWRCESPLLYYAKLSWFIKVSAVKNKLIKNNRQINWVPAYIKQGRFGEWLKDAKDWALSRERYWGTPLPIWQCQKCKKQKCIGSREELGNKNIDLHRPFIDKVTLKCSCGGTMKRVPEVLDCWFDSGSMPFAQYHYPFENKEKIDQGQAFPADYISEAIDQTRGWFYTLLAVSTLLDKGTPYKNVICLGHILDAQGEKMSKSKGNVVDPWQVINQYGAEALRWYLYTINQPGDSKRFDLKGVVETLNKFLLTLWNSYSFFVTYARIDNFKSNKPSLKSKNILDKWIISGLNQLIKKVTYRLDRYDITGAARQIEDFVNSLSNWYLRRSRRRFQPKAREPDKKDKEQAYQTLETVLITLSKLAAPFVPFISEEIYKNLTGEKSVHLSDYPKANEKLIDSSLEDKMDLVRQIAALGLAARAKAGIKVRQPLGQIIIKSKKLEKPLADLIKEELNVKRIKFSLTQSDFKQTKTKVIESDEKIIIALETKITDQLKQEGLARELVRQIQDLRKEAGYQPIDVIISATSSQVADKKWNNYIKEETLSKEYKVGRIKNPDAEKEIKIDQENIWYGIKKLKK